MRLDSHQRAQCTVGWDGRELLRGTPSPRLTPWRRYGNGKQWPSARGLVFSARCGQNQGDSVQMLPPRLTNPPTETSCRYAKHTCTHTRTHAHTSHTTHTCIYAHTAHLLWAPTASSPQPPTCPGSCPQEGAILSHFLQYIGAWLSRRNAPFPEATGSPVTVVP